jgi:23S rRNA maturation mini-RNase III
MAHIMTDEEIRACLQALVELMETLPEKDAQIIQRGIDAAEQAAHRRGLEDAIKMQDA